MSTLSNALDCKFLFAPDPCETFVIGSSISYSTIKDLDLSHNNISRISPGYFKPAELTLVSLNLAYNSMMVIHILIVDLRLISFIFRRT